MPPFSETKDIDAVPGPIHAACCAFIPLHLLEFIANSMDASQDARDSARNSLDQTRAQIESSRRFLAEATLKITNFHPNFLSAPNPYLDRFREPLSPGANTVAAVASAVTGALSSVTGTGGPDRAGAGTGPSTTTTNGSGNLGAGAWSSTGKWFTDAEYTLEERAKIDATRGTAAKTSTPIAVKRQVNKCANDWDVPGVPVRKEGQAEVSDAAVNEVYTNLGIAWQFFATVFDQDSVDSRGKTLIGNVHVGSGLANAYWNFKES